MGRRNFKIGSCAAVLLWAAGLLGVAPAHADERCTNQIDYAGDPRSNAEINSIGATTGQCPAPMTAGASPGGNRTAPAEPIESCDPSSMSGFEQCLGGGFDGDANPWQPSDCFGQHPTDYETACNPNNTFRNVNVEAEYLADLKASISGSDADKLKVGRTVCRSAAQGDDLPDLRAALVQNGLTYSNADLLTQSALYWLCPDV